MKRVELDAKKFFDNGVLPLRGFLPPKLVAAVQNSILSELTRLKIKVNGKIAASKIQNLPVFQQTGRLGQMIKVGDEIDRLFPEELLAAMNSLTGSPLKAASPQPQILLSLPHKEAWSLNHLNWHLDLTPPKTDQTPGVQAFVLIDDVQPQGGATLALAGSHKLHYVHRDHNAHGILRQHSEFVSAPEKFFEPQVVHGVRVQIVEMSGRAGDVYLMDLRVLHSPSINSRKDIRMMATNRFLRLFKPE